MMIHFGLWSNGEGQRELGKYHVFHEHNLDMLLNMDYQMRTF